MNSFIQAGSTRPKGGGWTYLITTTPSRQLATPKLREGAVGGTLPSKVGQAAAASVTGFQF